MKVIPAFDYENMSKQAADYVIQKLKAKPDLVLGLATGSTPKGLYRQLALAHRQQRLSFANVQSFNLDEYIGLPLSDPHSYHYFMQQELFGHIDIEDRHAHLPNGQALDLRAECERYEALLTKTGIDLQILGIGENGHIGFNEPGTSFEQTTHITDLTESTRKANARFFRSLEEVPRQAITMGIASILKSKEILLLASGTKKARSIQRLLSGEETEQFPASALSRHGQVTIIADESALSLANRKDWADD